MILEMICQCIIRSIFLGPFIKHWKRFEILNKARKEIEEHDLLVFIDADALVVNEIKEEEFFVDKPLFGVHHL